ncbi:GNAT family N-acetyltransferase [Vibrio sp. 404]|uniref:GNAT family N-acetyltransferase n=1 Tax=Vibrio marinisediminis TaxID=2758441 RepID=A0A7W2FND7_9VIBR|nr:GNAT family N-acetyltransferase [Vibrio marinisediminis]MBA5761282.1 GNAT family N-acetyltransferase [Vibrio marinisediminis]
MKIIIVDPSNQHIYMNLAQAYEAEFSKIMQKRPDENGLFPLDTKLEGNVTGYLLYVDGVPAGHTAIANESEGNYEVCDFYVVPYFRKNKVGKRFITQVFEMLGGRWEIKQVAGAEHAVTFWRDVLSEYTSGNYSEDTYHDEKWGVVTRQTFCHSSHRD